MKTILTVLLITLSTLTFAQDNSSNFYANRPFLPELTYSATKSNPNNKILYTNESEKSYLDSLKSKYPINIEDSKTQIAKVLGLFYFDVLPC